MFIGSKPVSHTFVGNKLAQTGSNVLFDKKSILFVGQSNNNRGTEVRTYINSFENYNLSDTLVSFTDPFGATAGTKYGSVFFNSSPGAGYAGLVADYIMSNTDGVEVVTVPAFKGGTGFLDVPDGASFAPWAAGGDHEAGMITRANRAKTFSNVVCVVQHLGEDDAQEGATKEFYKSSNLTLKSNFESQTGLVIPWIIVGLHKYDAGIPSVTEVDWNNIRQAQIELAQENDDIFYVDSSDLDGISGDEIHIDEDGRISLGSRVGKSVLQNVFDVSNPDMLFAQDYAYYYNFINDALTTDGTDITAITPSLDAGGSQNVGTTDRYPQLVTGVNGLQSMGVGDGSGFIRHEINPSTTQTVFLLGNVPLDGGGSALFTLGSVTAGSTSRGVTITSNGNLFMRDDANAARSLKDPIDEPQPFVIALRWNGETVLDRWFNSTTKLDTIDPEGISTQDRAWIGARASSGTVASVGAPLGLSYAVVAQYERAMTDAEIQNIIQYLLTLGNITPE